MNLKKPTNKKVCARCGLLKSKDAFYKNHSTADLLAFWCTDCLKENKTKYNNRIKISKKYCN